MLRKLKYGLSVFLIAVILLSRISCGKTGYAPISENRSENDTEIQNDSNYSEPEILTEITISAGDKQLDGVLFDNETAKLFAEMLPITADLWNPAPRFAKAFDLEEAIPDIEPHTRNYELGGLAYWYPGPSVAIFHSSHPEQTIVPVVTIGKINDDVSLFAEYEGAISITIKNS